LKLGHCMNIRGEGPEIAQRINSRK